MTIVLMAIFTGINFLAMRTVLQGQRRHHLVEGRGPGRSPSSCCCSSSTPATSAPAAASSPRASAGRTSSRRFPRRASCSPTSASSRPTSWPARSRTRSGTCRGRSSSPSLIGTVDLRMLQVVFIGAMTPSLLAHGGFAGHHLPDTGACTPGSRPSFPGRSPAWPASRARLAGHHPVHRRVHLPVRHRPDVPDLDLARRLRPGPQPVLPADLPEGRQNGVPWVSLIFAFLLGLVFLLPFPSWHSLVGLVTSACVLMYAGAPLSLGAFRSAGPRRPARTGCRAPRSCPRSRSSSPT